MGTVSELALHITAKSDAKAILDDTTKSASGFTSAVRGIGAAVGASAITGGLKSMTQSLSGFTQAAADDAASSGRLQQAIKNTGADFGTYAKQIEGVISVGQKLGFTDDQTRDSLSLLAAQTGSTEEAVKRYALAQDLARGANIDVVTASRLLGKVTDENVNVLARYGIKVAEGASETELFGAIAQKFGGQAKEFGDSTAGAASRAAIGMDEMRESMGSKLLPVMAQGLSLFQAMPGPLQVGAAAFLSFGPAAAQMTTGLMAVIPALSALGPAMGVASTAIKAMGMAMLTPPLGIVVALAAVGIAAYIFRDDIISAFGAAKDFVVGAAGAIADFLSTTWGSIVGGASAAWEVVRRAVSSAARAIATEVSASFNHLVQIVSGAGSAIVGEVTASWNHLVQVVTSAGQTALAEVTASWDRARQITSDAWAAVSQAVSDGWSAITGIVSAGVSAVLGLLADLVSRYIQGWQNILSTVTGIASEIYNTVAGTFSEIVTVVSGTMNEVVGAISGAASSAFDAARTMGANVYLGIKGEIEDLPYAMVAIGRAVVEGIWSGISGAAGWLYGKVSGFIGGLIDEAKSAAGIRSPSTEGIYIGEMFVQGLISGINAMGDEARAAVTDLARSVADAANAELLAGNRIGKKAGLNSDFFRENNPNASAATIIEGSLGQRAREAGIDTGGFGEMAAALAHARQMGYTLPPGFAHGASYVPRTGLAILHQGEAVIPASQNRGGVTELHVHLENHGTIVGVQNAEQWVGQAVRNVMLRGGLDIIQRAV